jgi:hypothetical protein
MDWDGAPMDHKNKVEHRDEPEKKKEGDDKKSVMVSQE